MSSLPEDIIPNILSRLPVKSLLRFRCVCKPWCNLLSNDSSFAKMHLNHAVQNKKINIMLRDLLDEICEAHPIHLYYLHSINCGSLSSSSCKMITYSFKSYPYDVIHILGSCNGLLCIEIDEKVIYIWNPSTQEYKEIPPPPPSQYPTPSKFNPKHNILYGFGYDCKIDDYKLIIIRSPPFHVGSDYCLYTLGSNSWKRSKFIHYNFSPLGILHGGVLANRALHWMQDKTTSFTVSFDISDESFQEIPLPNGLDDFDSLNLGVLGDSLCVFYKFYNVCYDLWVMKDYGVIESWSKLFTIAHHNGIYYSRPRHVLENGEVLFEASTSGMYYHGGDILVLYDPKHERATTFEKCGLPRWFYTETYVGSLVSLNSGTFLGKERKEETIEEGNKKKKKKR